MTNLPLVTIGALNYNNSKYVIETLESIKHQSYDNFELIIVDDCSTDNGVELIENWLKTFTKDFKFIKHAKNLGICASSNDLLKHANGKYFSGIATDDLMMPEKIKVQVEQLEKSENTVCAVYSDAYLINDNSSPRYGWFIQKWRNFDELPSGDLYSTLLEGNFIPAMSLLVKMECYKQVGFFDEDLQYEDYDMWLRLASKFSFIASDYVSVKYRVRKGSLMTVIKNWNRTNVKIYAKHFDRNPLAIKRLEDIAYSSYIANDFHTLSYLASYKDLSSFIKKVIYFNKMKIPRTVGKRLLFRMRKL